MEPRPVPQQASALGLSYTFSANICIFLGVSGEMLHGVYRVCLQLIVDFLSKSSDKVAFFKRGLVAHTFSLHSKARTGQISEKQASWVSVSKNKKT